MRTSVKTTLLAAALGLVSLTCLAGLAHAQNFEEKRSPLPAEVMPLAAESILNDIEAKGDGYIAVGERGHILLSKDGKTWKQVPSPTRAMLNRVHFIDANNGWIVGHDGVVLRSTDGGQSWQLKHYESEWGKPFYDSQFTSPTTGIVAGSNGRALSTTDGGETWTEITNPVFDTGFNIYGLGALSPTTMIVAGERGMLGRTLDGGETWDMLVPPYIGSYFGVLPTGEFSAILFGLQGRIYYAADVRTLPALEDPSTYDPFVFENITDPEKLAEMGWELVQTPVQQSLFGGTLYGNGNAVYVGVDGTVVYGPASSNTVKRFDGPTDEPVSDVVVSGKQMIMVGRTGVYHAQLP